MNSSSGSNEGGSLLFVVIIVLIVLASMLVPIWTRVLDNVSFNHFQLKEGRVWHTFVYAMIVTGVFIGLVWVIDNYFMSSKKKTKTQEESFDVL